MSSPVSLQLLKQSHHAAAHEMQGLMFIAKVTAPFAYSVLYNVWFINREEDKNKTKQTKERNVEQKMKV